MRRAPTVRALPLVAVLFAGAIAQDEGPDAKPVHAPAPDAVADPLASLARMVSGEWRLAAPENGKRQVDAWRWGPGQRSLRMTSHGTDGGELTNGSCRVVYWHPGREELALLGLFSQSRLAEGTLTVEGETADFHLGFHELALPGLRRELVLRWTFDGPDRYHEALWEATGTSEPALLAEWDYARSETLTPASPQAPEPAPQASQRLKALAPLVGPAWEAEGVWNAATAFHVRSSFAWVPYADAIHARVTALPAGGEPTHLLDAYLYRHPASDTLRCLALSSWGGVHEGDLTVLADGALQLELKSYDGSRVVPHTVRFDRERDGTLRSRIWSLAGTARSLLLDVRHAALAPERR